MKPRDFMATHGARAVLAGIAIAMVIGVVAVHEYRPSVSSAPHFSLSTTTPLIAGLRAAIPASSTPTTSATTTVSSTNKSTVAAATTKSTTGATALQSAPVSATVSARQLDSAGASLLHSLVNIICVSGDPSIPSISGSGVMIDSRGIILTAAHVAQFFTLADYLGPTKLQCLVRAGSPARRAYLAEPIYVSPTWIQDNVTAISQSAPKGTGENDFALIGITGTATSTPLPSSFPAVSLAQDDPQLGQSVAIGSYGAQYLTPSELNYALYPILVFGSVQSRYTFNTTTVDIVSISGSAASQEGSSGGGIVNDAGQLLGTITTSSVGGSIASRSLNAITIGHIRRSFAADTGVLLDSYLASESVSALIADFANQSKNLGAALVQANNF